MNLELAERVYKQIDEFPETFYMGMWAYKGECGTVACIAGHALLLSGYSVQYIKVLEKLPTSIVSYTRPCFISPDGEELENPSAISAAARELLDLSDEEWVRGSDSSGKNYGKNYEGLFFDVFAGKSRLKALIEKAREAE